MENNAGYLLGLDYGNPEISRKIIDVVSFAPDDSIIFGQKCFRSGEEKNSGLYLNMHPMQ